MYPRATSRFFPLTSAHLHTAWLTSPSCVGSCLLVVLNIGFQALVEADGAQLPVVVFCVLDLLVIEDVLPWAWLCLPQALENPYIGLLCDPGHQGRDLLGPAGSSTPCDMSILLLLLLFFLFFFF